MQGDQIELPPPDPTLHDTGSEGHTGTRGNDELALLEHFGMRPSSHILDVGCGIGRLAYECASYLDEGATYTGLDIEPTVIEWLDANYGAHLPAFQFDLLDVYGGFYRPPAPSRRWRLRRKLSPRRSTRRAVRERAAKHADPSAVSAEQARFPYEDERFDVACAFEVFMHMSPGGVQNYLREIARVLRPGGLAVVTLVAIHPDEESLRVAGRPFVRIAEDVYTRHPARPYRQMAYGLDLFRSMLGQAGLDELDLIKGRIHIPKDDRPYVAPGVEIPPLSHACDVVAAVKRDKSAQG